MEDQEIKEYIDWLEQQIDQSPRQLKYLKYDTFLEWFGMRNRRNPDRIAAIDRKLKNRGIRIRTSSEDLDSINDPSRGEYVTFWKPLDNKSGSGGKTFGVDYAGTIHIQDGPAPIRLHQHQEAAILNMNSNLLRPIHFPYATLLVLPTGGGKTLTATWWLAKNVLNEGKKVLWIAHRHELLNQAKEGFVKVAYKDIMPDKKALRYRLLSGIHDRPVNIRMDDDLLIAGKDSLISGLEYLEKWLDNAQGELFLVVDEAHHATAKTYRRLIEKVQKHTRSFRLLGLTATPFRTADHEQGLLKKVFPDESFHRWMETEILPLQQQFPDKLRLVDTGLYKQNQTPAGFFLFEDEKWRVNADSHFEKLLEAYNRMVAGATPFERDKTRGGRECLVLKGQRGKENKYIYIFKV